MNLWLILAVLVAVVGVVFVARAVRPGPGIRRAVHAEQYSGPDQLRLLQELDAHLDAYVAADPQLAAGFARLRRAARDEQRKKGNQ